jgi:arylsulfatase A-like enzyme
MPKDDPSWTLYQDKPWGADEKSGENAKMYAAMVNLVDRQVGDVRALLKELGLEKNTLIFLTGDNGAARYFPDGQHPEGIFIPNVDPKTGVKFRGFKAQLYEGGLRVPFIAHWPGHITAGRVSEHLCYFPDVMPTLAEFTGAQCPKDTDGISFVPELLGEKAAGRKQPQHEYLYWEHQRDVAVRMGSWKAIRVGGEQKAWELYNLAKDISESQNVAAQHADIVEKMKAFAAAAHTSVPPGEIYDRALVEQDRNYLGQAAGEPKAAKKAKKKAP